LRWAWGDRHVICFYHCNGRSRGCSGGAVDNWGGCGGTGDGDTDGAAVRRSREGTIEHHECIENVMRIRSVGVLESFQVEACFEQVEAICARCVSASRKGICITSSRGYSSADSQTRMEGRRVIRNIDSEVSR
jgi:hypothetical protein